MSQSFQLVLSPTPKRKVMVVSHERSGTHFLMNALALNLGYVSQPWVNLDFELGINFHSPSAILMFLSQFKSQQMRNVVKSHHQLAFFEPILPTLLDDFQMIYIYRHPGDVMKSFARVLNVLHWDAGPKCASAGELMRRETEGQLLRYQKRGLPNMIARWREHVGPWLDYAADEPRISVVRYEDLAHKFESTIRKLARDLGETVAEIRKPDPRHNVVVPREANANSSRKPLNGEDLAFMRKHAGALLVRLYPDRT
jgi:Sulfotransferase domain